MKKPAKRTTSRTANAGHRKDTPWSVDETGIFRLGVPMEAYDIVIYYQKVAGKIADFVETVIPMLTGDSYCKESVLRILKAGRYNDQLIADSILEDFVREVRNFQTVLANGFSQLNWVKEGERIACERIRKKAEGDKDSRHGRRK